MFGPKYGQDLENRAAHPHQEFPTPSPPPTIPGDLTCLPFIKKIPEILVGNFRSVRTVRIVYHLPKISGLSRRARLDSSYNMKLATNINRKGEFETAVYGYNPALF